MPRAFRFAAPVLRPDSVTRPRLLRALAERWNHRLTLVVGGAGFGKTTLLSQAIAENRLAPLGHDIWLGLEPRDADAVGLGADLLRAVRGQEVNGEASDASVIADAVWAQSPDEVMIMLDDVHVLPDDSSGLGLIGQLLDALPDNGHLVLASRTTPSIPFARLVSQGAVSRVAEDELRFDDGELADFAAARDVDADVVAASGGWPAMAELTAATEHALVGDYLWQEVLEPLGAERRRALATLVELGAGDDELLQVALDTSIDLASEIGGVPLVATDGAGQLVPHRLWSTVPSLRLDSDERLTVRSRAAAHLLERGSFAEAFELLADADAWDEVPALLVRACLGEAHLSASELARWIERCPPDVLATPGGLLAVGVHRRLTDPASAGTALRAAVEAFAEIGDVDGELAAIAHLGHAAWWSQDLAVMAELFPRVQDLEAAGHPTAIALAGIGRSLIADVVGDPETALAEVRAVPVHAVPAGWGQVTVWLEAAELLGLGYAGEALQVAERAEADPVFGVTVRLIALMCRWGLGEIDDTLGEWMDLVDDTAKTGIAHNIVNAAGQAALSFASVGDTDRARQALAIAEPMLDRARDNALARWELATAAISVAEADEAAAADVLSAAADRFPIDTGAPRRIWRSALSLPYIIMPGCRQIIDEAQIAGIYARDRELARAVAAVRDGATPDLDPITEESVNGVRAALHVRHAAELAVALAVAARPDAMVLFGALGEAGRTCVRDLAEQRTGAMSRGARALLAQVPAAPSEPVTIAVLGPMELHRRGRPVDEPALRRDRVRALLSMLIVRRRVTRADLMAALWPDFDARSAGNNLRVNLAHLERALEPGRSRGEAAWSIRHEGTSLQLVTGPSVTVDADRFIALVGEADAAEADGAPSIVLDRLLTAVDLWRGEPFADAPDAEWLDLPREHLRSRFVAAALRAGELLVGRDDPDRAMSLAERALAVDPWAEAAHALVVNAALATGDRAAARRRLERCHAMLDELGAQPSETLRVLARRARTSI